MEKTKILILFIFLILPTVRSEIYVNTIQNDVLVVEQENHPQIIIEPILLEQEFQQAKERVTNMQI